MRIEIDSIKEIFAAFAFYAGLNMVAFVMIFFLMPGWFCHPS